MSNRIEGWFIAVDDDEKKRITDYLEENGYETDSNGLKKYLIDSMEDTPEENEPESEIVRLLRENPQILAGGKMFVTQGINRILKKAGRK